MDTHLRVETLESTSGSTVEIGTSKTPIARNVEARVTFLDTGSFDFTTPRRGLVIRGDIRVHGMEKTAWDTLASHPSAGDASLSLSADPVGWQAGDELLVPGMNPDSDEDERRTIAGISGSTVTLDSALDHDHVPPADFDSYALNVSRNVEFRSENDTIERRGHGMIMSTGSDVRYAAFNVMGRTNKAKIPSESPRDVDLSGYDDNPRARYSFHYHKTGSGASEPHLARGLVVQDSPGWGFVNHHSYAHVEDCISYDVLGAGFVAEGGTERGSFKRNFALRSQGSGEPVDSRADGSHGGDPPVDDFGHAGHGFWLQGPLPRVVDNVAAGHRHQAFSWWLRPLLDDANTWAEASPDRIADSRVAFVPNIPFEYVDTEAQAPLLDAIENQRFSSDSDDQLMWDTQKLPSTFVATSEIRGNTAFASAGGVDFNRHNFKWKHERFSDFNVIEDMTVHSIGSFTDEDGNVLEPGPPKHLESGFQGNGGDVGVTFRYTSNVALKNSHIHGSGRENSLGLPFHDYLWTYLIENTTVENWDLGQPTGEHRLTWIKDCTFRGNNVDIHWTFDNAGPAIIDNTDANRIQNDFNYISEKAPEVLEFDQHRGVRVDGRSGHLDDSAADFVPFPDQDSLDGVNNIEKYIDTVDDETNLIGLTNEEMLKQYDICISGALQPDDAVAETWADGFKLDPVGGRDPLTTVSLAPGSADSLGGWQTVSGPDTSTGEYLTPSTSSVSRNNPASYTFDCAAGTYRLFGRIWPAAWNGGDISVRIDGGNWKPVEKIKGAMGYQWHDAAPKDGDAYTWDLDQGTHTVEVATPSGDIKLDELVLTTDQSVIGGYSLSATSDTNAPPSGSDDTVTVTKGGSATVDVLDNDTDSDGSLDASSVTVVSTPSKGTATVGADGTVEYAHDGSDTRSDSFTYTVEDDDGATSNETTVSVTIEASKQEPYTSHDLAQIQAEDFDTGGEGVAYHDTSSGNNGGAYRNTDVDIQQTSDTGGGYNIGWIEPDEWWEYTVDVPEDEEYALAARVAGKNDTTLSIAVDGSSLATVDVPNRGGWQDWTTVDAGTVTLTAGTHTFRVTANGGDFNFNWFGFEQTDTTAPAVPSNLSASDVTDTSVELAWDASSDSGSGVDHYNVYQDGTVVTQVPVGTTTTTVDGLSPTTTYDFYVTAVDGAGSESDPSNTISITTDQETKTVEVTGAGAATYNSGSDVRYIIETTGTVGSATVGDLESSDRTGGSKAAGKVPADGSDTDTYALTGGKVTDVSSWGGDVTVTVDGTTWSK